MSLREKITLYCVGNNYGEELKNADAILALPSGLIAVRECDCEDGYVGTEMIGHKKCHKCHGTGRLVRDISVQEVNNLPAMILTGSAIVLGYAAGDRIQIVLTSGERVEVKK